MGLFSAFRKKQADVTKMSDGKHGEHCECGHDLGARAEGHAEEKEEAKPLPIPPLGERDHRNLVRNGYEKAKEKFPDVYVIRNGRTGQVAELHACSTVHAANLIGWRPRQVFLLGVKKPEPKAEPKAEEKAPEPQAEVKAAVAEAQA
jgi:hypothetical protein